MLVPERRTLLVLATLIAAMTLASGVLLVLEPQPLAPGSQIVLSSIDGTIDPERVLFNTPALADRHAWSAIVIQQSGGAEGSAAKLSQLHEKLGLGGLGYHFVIGNGQGMPDGQIEAGFRWTRQIRGAFNSGVNNPALDRRTIGVCLIGDGRHQPPTESQIRELVWLVRKLQAKFDIPADRVMLQTRPEQGGVVSRLFPVADFRQQLLTLAAP